MMSLDPAAIPQWLVLAAMPLLALLILCGWFTLILRRSNLVCFTLKGFGLSISVKTSTVLTRKEDKI